MLRQMTRAATPDLQKFVDGIISEETKYRMKDRRSVGREPFVRPVEVTPHCHEGDSIRAISKDISGLGIGLVSNDPMEPGKTARLKIHRLNGQASIVLAECKWCEQHMAGWYQSGWVFTNVDTF